jgi:uncharacterized membrane protein (UPF0127 family)
MAHGIPGDRIIQVSNPYYVKEVLFDYSPSEVEAIYLVGEKDMAEDPRFNKTEGVTKEGYKWSVEVAPHVTKDVEGEEMSGTSLRATLANADEETFYSIMGFENKNIFDLLTQKFSQKKVDEDLYNPEDKVLDYMRSNVPGPKKDIPRAYKYKRGGMYTGGGMGFGGMYESRGGESEMHIYDFDETIARALTPIPFTVSTLEGSVLETGDTTSKDFEAKKGELEGSYDEGSVNIDFDFSEFDKLIGDAILNEPVWNDLLNSMKDSNVTTTILTARSIGKPVTDYLKRMMGEDEEAQGLETPYVVALGLEKQGAQVTGEDKANWIKKRIKDTTKKVIFTDDASENTEAVKKLKTEFPEISFEIEKPPPISSEENIDEMRGTMNKQEMARHKKNLKRLRKYTSKQGNKYVPVPDFIKGTLKRKLYEHASANIDGNFIPLEIMDTPDLQVTGMMHRNKLEGGMAFPYDGVATRRFHTQNCKIPLDIIFINQGEVDSISHNCPPCQERNCPKYSGMADTVLELPGGYCKQNNVNVGDKIGLNLLKPPKPLFMSEATYRDIEQTFEKPLYSFTQDLDSYLKEPKVKAVLDAGLADGDPNDDKISYTRGPVDIANLQPTQNVIGFDNSVQEGPLENKYDTLHTAFGPDALADVGGPIVTYGSQYIIDGHHRWSATYAVNPDAKLDAINITPKPGFGPLDILKAVHTSIALKVDDVPRSQASAINLLQGVSYAGVLGKVEKYLTDKAADVWAANGLTTKEDIASHLHTNLEQIVAIGHVDGAPDRIDMPQADSAGRGTEEDRIKDLTTGRINISPPYAPSDISNRFVGTPDQPTLPGLNENSIFSKEWWKEIIIEQILTEGGAAGHMAHPFNLPDVNSGQDLKDIFKKSSDSLQNTPGSVKIDGVNSSIRLVDLEGTKQFVMDRGSKMALDVKGITKDDLESRFKPGHGMIEVGGAVLDMFNEALPSIKGDLEKLGAYDNPNILFNMEYVSGKTNVQDYDSNFIAIHGLNQIELDRTEVGQRASKEISYDKSALQSLLDNLAPIAKERGFEVYGSVPTEMTKEPNFSSALSQRYTIVSNEGEKTQTLDQWLNELNNIPEEDFIFINVDDSKKKVGAVSKLVYTTLLNRGNIDELFENEEDKQKAIEGFTTYLATEKLGDEVLKVLDSPMGTVDTHEGVVIRDENIANVPFKITGKFILGGIASDF